MRIHGGRASDCPWPTFGAKRRPGMMARLADNLEEPDGDGFLESFEIDQLEGERRDRERDDDPEFLPEDLL